MQGASIRSSLFGGDSGWGDLQDSSFFAALACSFLREEERWKKVLLVGVKKFTKNRFFLLKSFFRSCIVIHVIDVRCDSGP